MTAVGLLLLAAGAPLRARPAAARATHHRFELINADFAAFTALSGELRGVDERALEVLSPVCDVRDKTVALVAATRVEREQVERQCGRWAAVRDRRRELERCARFIEVRG